MIELLTALAFVVKSNAFFGLIGGAGYAGTKLATALWSGSEIDSRARKLALAQFATAIMLAPAAAHTLAPVVAEEWPTMKPQAAAMMIGMMFNAVWPVVTEKDFLRKLIADGAAMVASKLGSGVVK